MLSHMLDTNICVHVFKERPQSVLDNFRLHNGAIGISSITLAELEHGAEKSDYAAKNLLILRDFLTRVSLLSFDATAAHHYGQIRVSLEKTGKPIGPLDTLIAAHARSLGLTLVTNNRREFDRVPGLRVENWVDEAPR